MMTEAPLINVSTAQLAYLAAVSRARTWGEAAEALGVTPSGLSQGIAELERRLGVELFTWHGRRRVPLDHTAEIVRYAERVLAETADLGRWLGRVRSGQLGQIRIGMIDAAAVYYFGTTLRDLRRDRPELDLHLSVAPTGELLDALRAGRIDLAVCVGGDQLDDLDVTDLLTEDLAVYAPDGPHDADPSTWGPWVLFPRGSRTRAVVERCLSALGVIVDVEAESHQPDVLREMVRMGLGWSVLPVVQAESGAHPLHRAMPEPLAQRTLVAARRPGGTGHPALAGIVAQLQGDRSRTAGAPRTE